jgi:hypothetical protein
VKRDVAVDGMKILKWISKKYVVCENVDWIRVAQDTVQWLAPVNMVMNLRVA